MGIYGSDGVVKTINAMARERQDRADRRAARMEAREERLRAHLDPLEPRNGPDEDLACPYCFEHYRFGDDCPECGSPLVGVQALEVERAGATRTLAQRLAPALGMLLSSALCVGLLVLIYAAFSGSLYTPMFWLLR
jgi:hypothetical protein